MTERWILRGSRKTGYKVDLATDEEINDLNELQFAFRENAELTCSVVNDFWKEDSPDDAYAKALLWRSMVEIFHERGMTV